MTVSEPICDFCGGNPPEVMFPVGPIRYKGCTVEADWAACRWCAVWVEHRAMDELIKRVVKLHVERRRRAGQVLHPGYVPGFRRELEKAYTVFFDHWKGEVLEWV